MRLRRSEIISQRVLALLIATAVAAGSCKKTDLGKRSKLRNEKMDLGAQCTQILEDARKQGIQYSEESIYRGLFQTISMQRLPLDKAADNFANKISEDFLHFSGLAYARKYGNQNFRNSRFADGFRMLVRAYVSLLGPSHYGNLESQNANITALIDNNALGQLLNGLRDGADVIYEQRAGKFLEGLQAKRGIDLPDLMLVYMMDQYRELFHTDDIGRSQQKLGVSSHTPSDLILNKTTPALACNNHAAQVVAEPIPWKQLGMDHYEGFGFVPWFHEPIARFRFEYPVLSGMIPVFGAAMNAADSLVSIYEGRDGQGKQVGNFEGSAFFAFHFTMAVLDAFAVKSTLQSTRDMVSRIGQRVKGLEPGASGLQELTAVIKDEAMAAEAAGRPFMGRNMSPCALSAGIDLWSFSDIAYAGGLPCIKGLGEVEALHKNISNAQRIDVIKDVKIADVMSAPGHQYLRDPDKVIGLSEHIVKTGGTGFEAEPILLNVFTNTLEDGSVAVRSIEVIDGNHRFAAGLLSGKWKSIGDIPEQFVKVKVNGWNAGAGAAEARWIPLEIAEKSTIPRQSWFRVPEHWQNVKGPTAQIPGDIASVDAVIPLEYRGVRMEDVLRTSLKRVNAEHLFP